MEGINQVHSLAISQWLPLTHSLLLGSLPWASSPYVIPPPLLQVMKVTNKGLDFGWTQFPKIGNTAGWTEFPPEL